MGGFGEVGGEREGGDVGKFEFFNLEMWEVGGGGGKKGEKKGGGGEGEEGQMRGGGVSSGISVHQEVISED